ncbi:MAG: hypothetical protein JWM03_1614 [Rhodocyclales bacterium]|nr:hypothetical protein [Rhodocyclales bacterium]
MMVRYTIGRLALSKAKPNVRHATYSPDTVQRNPGYVEAGHMT